WWQSGGAAPRTARAPPRSTPPCCREPCRTLRACQGVSVRGAGFLEACRRNLKPREVAGISTSSLPLPDPDVVDVHEQREVRLDGLGPRELAGDRQVQDDVEWLAELLLIGG